MTSRHLSSLCHKSMLTTPTKQAKMSSANQLNIESIGCHSYYYHYIITLPDIFSIFTFLPAMTSFPFLFVLILPAN